MAKEFAEHGIRFAFVCAREAHPGENIPQASTLEEKREYARLLREANGVSWPVLVDDLDGSLHRALDAMEEDQEFLTKGGVFSKDFIASYIALKREEQEAFEATPCPIEFQMYYSV